MSSNIHLSNLISIAVNKIYNFDIPTSMAISSLAISVLSMIEFNIYYMLIFIPIGLYYYYSMYSKKETDKYKISVHDSINISKILWYMKEYPNFFDKNYNIEFGNQEYIKSWENFENDFIPETESIININDTLYNITGYIAIKLFTYTFNYDKEGKPQKRERMYFEFNLNYNNKNIVSNYVEFIRNHHKEKTQICTVYGLKYFPNKDEPFDMNVLFSLLYQGKVLTPEELYNKYLGSFFSPVKNELWKRIKNIHYHPESILNLGQIPSFNLLAYGPPGTGKSTFAYRVAMALNRHLISIDLSSCNDILPENIYNVIKNPILTSLALTKFEAKDCVIVLEEFDRTVFTLNEKKEKKDMSFCFPWMNKQDEKQPEKESEKKDSCRNKEFDLGDLLELIQGPIPNPGSIIIATTNHYEKIKEILPALFRPGRLTPVKFDYLDWNTLQELSVFYFQKELSIQKIDTVNIPTSKIIDLAVTYKLENNFDGFQKELSSLISINLG